MSRLQEDVFQQTKNLVGKVNLFRIILYTLISAVIIIAVLYLFDYFTIEVVFIILIMSLLYSFLRDFSITKYSAKQMQVLYNYSLEKHGDIDLYIPVFKKSRQGYLLKRSALIIKDGELFLEAFKQKRSKKQQQVSISVKYGEKFVIDFQKVDKNGKTITFDSTFATQYYRFSIVNNKEALNLIEKAKKGGL
ncbi:MAG: hypothetical protein K9L64_01905 [Candidatus Izimaplasma sp.]|nr:hypothetical protein [Candidatus Izimaplasma bacterium]